VLVKRPDDVVSQDWEFGRQMLAGFNPSTITALRQMPEQMGSAIRDEDVAGRQPVSPLISDTGTCADVLGKIYQTWSSTAIRDENVAGRQRC
jgi:hypothetical protein